MGGAPSDQAPKLFLAFFFFWFSTSDNKDAPTRKRARALADRGDDSMNDEDGTKKN